MRTLAAVLILLCAGCASYITPGGPVHLDQINRADNAEVVVGQPSPQFPANIALVRVQAPQYRSFSSKGYGTGRFSVLAAPELLTEEPQQNLSKWPSVTDVEAVPLPLLPVQLSSLEDLRLAAAKLQADVLMVYTVDTSFQVQGQDYGPLSAIPLGSVPVGDASITSTASAVFTDVRTGFTYGTAQATVKTTDLGKAWASADGIDQKRLETEHQAFASLLSNAEKTWTDIVQRYQ